MFFYEVKGHKLTYCILFYSSTHVLTEDTIKRDIVDGKLCTTRFLTKTGGGLPRWAERFVPHKLVTIVEESVVDPQRQTLTTYTRNIGYHNRIVVCIIII